MPSKIATLTKFACKTGVKLGAFAATGYAVKTGIDNVAEYRQYGKEEWLERKRRQLSHAWNEKRINWGLGHAAVTVSSFEKAVQWYDRMFGMKLMNYMEISGEDLKAVERLYHLENADLKLVRLGFLASGTGALLEVFEFDPPLESPERETWNRPGYTHICFNVSGMSGWRHRLEREGVEFVTDLVRSPGADWMFFRDPDNNLVELIDFHATRLALGKWGGRILGPIFKYTTLKNYYRAE